MGFQKDTVHFPDILGSSSPPLLTMFTKCDSKSLPEKKGRDTPQNIRKTKEVTFQNPIYIYKCTCNCTDRRQQ